MNITSPRVAKVWFTKIFTMYKNW